MQQIISLKLLPSQAQNDTLIHDAIAESLGKKNEAIKGFILQKKSIDARGKQPYVNLTLQVFINEPFYKRMVQKIVLQNVAASKNSVAIIGAGPAGLFAALQLAELGIKPIILERGKDVRARRRDLASLNKHGIINAESNYCFGEGGAGTYSDGKLYTRSSKRGSIDRILNILAQFGADESILYEAHPHIGTNKLPQIITAIREHLVANGAEFLFEKKVADLVLKDEKIKAVITADGDRFEADAFILATGHSARDVFELLYHKNILIEAKPFALGVRIEHPQALIDSLQYHCAVRGDDLPPASYSLVEQVQQKGVFSFCMCPGGIIAPAATNNNELVVNGWSPSKRNNPFANSGMVVSVDVDDAIKEFEKKHSVINKELSAINISNTINHSINSFQNSPLSLMHFQQAVEQRSFTAGGGKFVAPSQRMVDFCENKLSSSLPDCSYVPGLNAVTLNNVLPHFIDKSLKEAFKNFGKKRKGFYTNEAIVVATESRTSSPVRIPRDAATLQHPQVKNLYPCGEGAGYAGGIVSAAMDGENVANMIAQVLAK